MLINSVKYPVAILILLSGLYAVVGNIVFFITEHSMPYIGVVLPYAIFIAVVWAVLRFIKELEHKTITGDFSILPKVLDNRIKLDKHSLRMMIFVLRFSVVSIVAFSLLSMLGVSLSGLLAFGGLGGIVLGFALKDILGNFFAGAILFWERPFLVGDWIRCPSINIEGVVDSINWRTTLIKTFDRRPVYVPNSVLINNYVENAQRMTNRRIYETIGVRYDDLDNLPALLDDIRLMVKAHSGIDDAQSVVVAFDKYGDFSLNFFVCGITYTTTWEEFQTVKEDILLQVAALAKKHKVEFAYPTSRIQLDKNDE